MTKPVYPNPIPKHLQHLSEWRLRALFYLFRPRQEVNMNDLKEYFANMQGLEWVSWYVLKPIALILTVIAFIILQEVSDDRR